MQDNVFEFKAPPHSLEAEQSLLGALLLDNQSFDRVADLVTAEDFYRDDHRRIWRHIARMIEQNRPADVVTVSESVDASEDKDKTGGLAYLGSLAQNTPSALNIRRYAELVRDKSIQRRLARIATGIAEEALNPGSRELTELLDSAETQIFQIADSGVHRGDGPKPIKPFLAAVFEKIDHLYHRDNPSDVTGIATGYDRIDKMTSGLQAGDLIIIAARPSMGKTALALNIAEHVAVDNGLPVVIFSMEMSGTQLSTRLLGSIGRIDHHKLRTGRLDDREWQRLSEAMGKLHDTPIHIDEDGALTALEIRSRARRLKRQYRNLGVVVIDYLQLMEAQSKGENRATDLSEITRSLKAMAKELDCPVIALSQLSRAVDQRPDRRPIMSDLRESGAIEQDADVILFIYREVVYKPDLPAEERGRAEVIIGKQRNGPIGMLPLTFIGQYTKFENYTDDGAGEWLGKRSTPRAVRAAQFDGKAAASGDDR